jgi:hypothetical protein
MNPATIMLPAPRVILQPKDFNPADHVGSERLHNPLRCFMGHLLEQPSWLKWHGFSSARGKILCGGQWAWDQMIRDAVDNGLVIRDGICVYGQAKGNRPYGYMVPPEHRIDLETFVVHDQAQLRRMAKLDIWDGTELYDVHLWLRQNLKRLTIVADDAIAYAMANLSDEAKNPGEMTSRQHGLNHIKAIANGAWWLKVAPTGRVFTAFTGLNRGLRQFARFDGTEPLYGIDVVSAQPLENALLAADPRLKECLLDYMQGKGRIHQELSIRSMCSAKSSANTREEGVREAGGGGGGIPPGNTPLITSSCNSYTFIRSHLSLFPQISNSPADAIDAIRHCIVPGLDFYTNLANAFGGVTRDEAKKLWAMSSFDRPRPGSKRYEMYKQAFPSLVRTSEEFHSIGINPASALQTLEATLMIYGVCSQLMERYPEMPIVTLHDCIYTTETYVPIVRDVVTEVWLELLGVAPRTKSECA